MIDNLRAGPNVAKAMNMVGDVRGKTVIILEDMIDTAGTLVEATNAVIKEGAKMVYATATHAVLSGPAVQRIRDSQLTKVIVTDTVPLSAEAQACDKIVQLSVADILAEAIYRIHNYDSVSSLFI